MKFGRYDEKGNFTEDESLKKFDSCKFGAVESMIVIFGTMGILAAVVEILR